MPRVPLSEWTQVRCREYTIYVADKPSLAGQGLAGATDEFRDNDAMYFLKAIDDPTRPFNNEDNGYGPVEFDIKIAFLDAQGRVLGIHLMEAKTGSAPPDNKTAQAIEARPPWFQRMGFVVGEKSPVFIKVRPCRRNDCYPDLST